MAKTLKNNKEQLFRLGLGSIFLANSVTAWAASDEFRDLLTNNSLTSHIGHTDLLIKLVAINDAVLFLLILSGKLRKLAVVWGGVWLIAVIYVTGFWTTDFIEHIGVLALLVYYSLMNKPK
ncbi:hypothetical protein H0X09_00995 [Candidatus Saccharibacteria bacterium]|nr:hypothetical protein [Candidatus Saccharibacteria bacterium]